MHRREPALMRAVFYDTTLIEYKNAVEVSDRRQAVRDNDDSLSFITSPKVS